MGTLGQGRADCQLPSLFDPQGYPRTTRPEAARRPIGYFPAYDANGYLQTIQMIDSRGNKRFLKDGQVQGGSFGLKGDDESGPLYLVSHAVN